jgi:hypothetical protein
MPLLQHNPLKGLSNNEIFSLGTHNAENNMMHSW